MKQEPGGCNREADLEKGRGPRAQVEGHRRGRQGRTPDPEEGAAGAGGAMTGAAARGRSLRLPRGRTPGRPWGGSGSPPKPHPPSGLGRPLESGCLSPRKGSETLIGFSVLPGTPSPHQGPPPASSRELAHGRRAERGQPPGHRGQAGHRQRGRGTLWGGALSRPRAAPAAQAPLPPGSRCRKGAGAGRPRAPCHRASVAG